MSGDKLKIVACPNGPVMGSRPLSGQPTAFNGEPQWKIRNWKCSPLIRINGGVRHYDVHNSIWSALPGLFLLARMFGRAASTLRMKFELLHSKINSRHILKMNFFKTSPYLGWRLRFALWFLCDLLDHGIRSDFCVSPKKIVLVLRLSVRPN